MFFQSGWRFLITSWTKVSNHVQPCKVFVPFLDYHPVTNACDHFCSRRSKLWNSNAFNPCWTNSQKRHGTNDLHLCTKWLKKSLAITATRWVSIFNFRSTPPTCRLLHCEKANKNASHTILANKHKKHITTSQNYSLQQQDIAKNVTQKGRWKPGSNGLQRLRCRVPPLGPGAPGSPELVADRGGDGHEARQRGGEPNSLEQKLEKNGKQI